MRGDSGSASKNTSVPTFKHPKYSNIRISKNSLASDLVFVFILYTSNKMMISHCTLPQIISFGPAIAKCKKKKHYVHEVVRNACKDDHVDGIKMSFFLSTNIKYISY